MNMDPLTYSSFLPFGPLTGSVPSVPDFYWNAVSEEQRWKYLCVNFQKLTDYTNTIAAKHNEIVEELSKLGATPKGTTTFTSVPANGTASQTVSYPTHTGTGQPSAIVATIIDTTATNLTATVTGKTDDGFTITVFNNSGYEATNVEVDHICIWD